MTIASINRHSIAGVKSTHDPINLLGISENVQIVMMVLAYDRAKSSTLEHAIVLVNQDHWFLVPIFK